MEGLVILSLCLLGPPRFSATAHCTSLVGSAKKVVVVPSFSISCEMKFLCFLGAGKGEEVDHHVSLLLIPVTVHNTGVDSLRYLQ